MKITTFRNNKLARAENMSDSEFVKWLKTIVELGAEFKTKTKCIIASTEAIHLKVGDLLVYTFIIEFEEDENK